jgi:RsiW-degrading membrane proteinase PrsW (M82 family)
VNAGESILVRPGQIIQLGATYLQLVAPDLPPSILKLAHAMPPSPGSTVLRSSTNTWLALRNQAYGQGRWGLIALALLFFVGLVSVLIGIVTLITAGLPNNGSGLLAKLTIPLSPALGIAILIELIDRYERRPWYLLLSTFLWGALIAIPPAFLIEKFFDGAIQGMTGPWLGITQSFFLGMNAGLTEETFKGIGLLVLVVLVRNKFSSISDGIIYGATIGAGFGMVENIAYFAMVRTQGDLVVLIIGRIMLGWMGHSTFTACFGAAVGYVRERRPAHRPWLVPLFGFAIAVALHTFFDFIAVLASDAGLGSPGPVLLALFVVIIDYLPLFVAQWILYGILVRAIAQESAILREYLVPEVIDGMVLPEEYLLLQQISPRQRLGRSLIILRDPRLWFLLRQLQRALVGLGFARWYEAMISRNIHLPLSLLSAENYRHRIRHLRRAIAQMELSDPAPSDASLAESGSRR